MPEIMERQPIELGASHCRPEDASHEVVLAPQCASRRREDEVVRATVARRQLLRRNLGGDDRQMNDALSP